MVETALRTIALADATVTGLMATRLYWGKLPQGVTLPAATGRRVSGPRVYTHSGSTGLAEGRFQFDTWATTALAAKNAAAALRGALESYSGTEDGTEIQDVRVVTEIDLYEPQEGDNGVYRTTLDFWVQYHE